MALGISIHGWHDKKFFEVPCGCLWAMKQHHWNHQWNTCFHWLAKPPPHSTEELSYTTVPASGLVRLQYDKLLYGWSKPTKQREPDDIPQWILREFTCELTQPKYDILKEFFQQGQFSPHQKDAIVVLIALDACYLFSPIPFGSTEQ